MSDGPKRQTMSSHPSKAAEYANESSGCCNCSCPGGSTLTFGVNLCGCFKSQKSEGIDGNGYHNSQHESIKGVYSADKQLNINSDGVSNKESLSCFGQSMFACQCNCGKDCGASCTICSFDLLACLYNTAKCIVTCEPCAVVKDCVCGCPDCGDVCNCVENTLEGISNIADNCFGD